MEKYVPIRSERSFRRHKAAGARFEANSKRNMDPAMGWSVVDTYFSPFDASGWVTARSEGLSCLRRGMAVRAVYDEAQD